jgi:hypothetical protein
MARHVRTPPKKSLEKIAWLEMFLMSQIIHVF